jgi:[CysO sulfur-carrier protein]-S-L-cysteine hydrolase
LVNLLLPLELQGRLVDALGKAGRREIGGILMAEHVAENVFRVMDLTIQRRGGSFATFVRAIQSVLGPLREFFRATHHDYARFNYIGEWHSHPSFAPVPSTTDHSTMHSIIENPDVGAFFVVLMIVKLGDTRGLEGGVTVYQPGGRRFQGHLVMEGHSA